MSGNVSNKLCEASSVSHGVPNKPFIMLLEQMNSPFSSLIGKLPDDALTILEAQVPLFKQLKTNGIYDAQNELEGATSQEAKNLLEHSLLILLNKKKPIRSLFIHQKILEIGILLEYHELEKCAKILENVLEEAEKAELFGELDLLLNIKQKLIIHGILKEKQVDENRLDMLKNKERLINYQNYICLNLKVEMLMSATARKRVPNSQFGKLLANPLLKSESMALSVRSRCAFYMITGLINAKMKRYEQSQKCFKKAIDIYQSNPYFIEESIKYTVILYSSFINVSIAIAKYDEALLYIQKIENLMTEGTGSIHQEVNFDIQLRSISQKIMIYNAQYQYAKVIQQIPHVKKYLQKSPKSFRINYQQNTIRHIATAYQALQQKQEAFEWWDLLESYDHPEISSMIQAVSKIQKITLLIDQKNKELLEKIVVDTKEYFKKNHIQGKYENLLLAMFNNIVALQDLDSPKIPIILQEYLPLLESFIEPNSQIRFDYRISIINWIKANIIKLTINYK